MGLFLPDGMFDLAELAGKFEGGLLSGKDGYDVVAPTVAAPLLLFKLESMLRFRTQLRARQCQAKPSPS
jgi:hypothetical protein